MSQHCSRSRLISFLPRPAVVLVSIVAMYLLLAYFQRRLLDSRRVPNSLEEGRVLHDMSPNPDNTPAAPPYDSSFRDPAVPQTYPNSYPITVPPPVYHPWHVPSLGLSNYFHLNLPQTMDHNTTMVMFSLRSAPSRLVLPLRREFLFDSEPRLPSVFTACSKFVESPSRPN